MSGSIAAIAAYDGTGTQGYGTTDKFLPNVKSVFWNENDTDKYYVNGSSVSEVPSNKQEITSKTETIVFTFDNDSDAINNLTLGIERTGEAIGNIDTPIYNMLYSIERLEVCVGNQVISTINTTQLVKEFFDSGEHDIFQDTVRFKSSETAQLMVSQTTTGGIKSITAGLPGSGYTDADTTVTIASAPSGGRSATAKAIIVSGGITGYYITDPGSGYSAGTSPTVTVSGGDGIATATSTVSSTCAETIDVYSGGYGYDADIDVYFSSPGGTSPNGYMNIKNGKASNIRFIDAEASTTSPWLSCSPPTSSFAQNIGEVFAQRVNLNIFSMLCKNGVDASYLMGCANNQSLQIKLYPQNLTKNDFNNYVNGVSKAIFADYVPTYTFRLYSNKYSMTNPERDFLKNQVVPKRTSITQYAELSINPPSDITAGKSITVNCDHFNLYTSNIYITGMCHNGIFGLGGFDVELYLNSTSYSGILPYYMLSNLSNVVYQNPDKVSDAFLYYKIPIADCSNVKDTDQNYVPFSKFDTIRVVLTAKKDITLADYSDFFNTLTVIAEGKCTALYQNGSVVFNNY